MISFREVTLSDAVQLMEWRCKERVTKYMATDFNNTLDQQQSWLLSCYSRDDYYHWIIKVNQIDIGLIYIDDFQPNYHKSSFGIYIGNDSYLNLSPFIFPYFFNFLIYDLKIITINAYVFSTNPIISLYKYYGFYHRNEFDVTIKKNSENHLMEFYSLSANKWTDNIKFSKMRTIFPMSMWKKTHIKK